MTALRTERLVLDAPRESDIDAVFAACSDAVVQQWIPIPSPYTREDAEFFVRSYVPHGAASGRFCVWALRIDDGPLLGRALDLASAKPESVIATMLIVSTSHDHLCTLFISLHSASEASLATSTVRAYCTVAARAMCEAGAVIVITQQGPS